MNPSKAANPFIEYTHTVDMAVCVLAGTCFNDIYPHSHSEIILTMIFMVIGSLLYGKIFGDLEHAIVLLKAEKSLKKLFFNKII